MTKRTITLECETMPVAVAITAKPGDRVVILHGAIVAVLEDNRKAAADTPRSLPGRPLPTTPTRDAILAFVTKHGGPVKARDIAAAFDIPPEQSARAALSFRLRKMIQAGELVSHGANVQSRTYSVKQSKPKARRK